MSDHAAAIAGLPRWHPNPRVQDAIRQIRARGWCVTAVAELCRYCRADGEIAPECEAPENAVAYSTGMILHDIPELLVYGLDSVTAEQVLNACGAQLHDYDWRELVADEVLIMIEGLDHTFQLIEALDKSDMTITGFLFPDSPALQVVWSDDLGLFPWHEGYSLGTERQPLKGVPATITARRRGPRVISDDTDGRLARRRPRHPKAS